MIRFIHCMKARSDLSTDEFRRFFTSPEMRAFFDQAVEMTDAISYKICPTLNIDANLGLQEERGGAEPFDGVIEIWWESGADLMKIKDSEEFKQAMYEATAYQMQFVDFSRSSRFFVED